MRIPTTVADQYIYFVAVDSADYVTRETGLSSFTVYRSRNGGSATAYTTPTVTEVSAANMPGVYKLLLDEDVTLDSGDQSQEICLHITATGMAPVTRVIELYRPSVTDGERITVASGQALANVAAIGASVITATSIATDAITASKIAADAIGASELASDAVTEIQSGLATASALTTVSGKIDTIDDFVDTEVAAIKAKTDSLTFTVANQLDVNVLAISGDTTAADNLETAFDDTAGPVRWLDVIDQGTAQSANSTGIRLRSAAAFADDELNGALVLITGGSAGVGQVRQIIDYTSSTDFAVVSGWTTTPTGTITYRVLPLVAILDSAGVRQAIGLASANLDNQLTAIDDYLDTEVAAIKAKTDNLPSDPADASDIATAFSGVNTKLDTIDDFLDTEIAAIKAKTDNLPSDPADESVILAAITAAVGAVWDELVEDHVVSGSFSDLITYMNGNVFLVKAATDNLPSDPADQSVLEGKIDTIDGIVDAIKAKTDDLTFTVAGQVDANIESVNGTEVIGTGTAEDPWGPD